MGLKKLLLFSFIAWIPEGKVLTPEFLQGKVRVSFACTPAEAEVKVFSAGAESGTALVPEQDGTYLLSPGSYSYQAGAEGYETFQDTFQVDLASGALRVEITLEPSATDPSETEPSTEEPTNPEGPTETPTSWTGGGWCPRIALSSSLPVSTTWPPA